jgi:hypothetical protein
MARAGNADQDGGGAAVSFHGTASYASLEAGYNVRELD